MGKDTELVHLEQQIERLLQRYATLKEENGRLQKVVFQIENDNNDLRSKLSSLEKERGDVRSRVGVLIDRIDRWETELSKSRDEGSEGGTDVGARSESGDGQQGEEERLDSVVQRKPERDGGVQGNLFRG